MAIGEYPRCGPLPGSSAIHFTLKFFCVFEFEIRDASRLPTQTRSFNDCVEELNNRQSAKIFTTPHISHHRE
jgi:hypothetical protein